MDNIQTDSIQQIQNRQKFQNIIDNLNYKYLAVFLIVSITIIYIFSFMIDTEYDTPIIILSLLFAGFSSFMMLYKYTITNETTKHL